MNSEFYPNFFPPSTQHSARAKGRASANSVLKGYRCEMPIQILPPAQQSRLALRTVIGK